MASVFQLPQRFQKTAETSGSFPVTSVYFAAGHSPKNPKVRSFLVLLLSAETDKVNFSASVNRDVVEEH